MLPGILPDFEEDEALETAKIYSAAGEPPWPRLITRRPFRTAHHSVTPAGLVGCGNPPRPGEITFAHGGVLFLDEFSEFRRESREALRQPLECRGIGKAARVARTIADLAEEKNVSLSHVAEALQYRLPEISIPGIEERHP